MKLIRVDRKRTARRQPAVRAVLRCGGSPTRFASTPQGGEGGGRPGRGGTSANLFAAALPPREGERFETILSHRNLVVERILSSAAITPCEYVQPQDEWVVLVQGEATLRVAGETMVLKTGDHLFLPAGVPHTVERVSAGAIWLAVHLYPEEKSGVP